VVAAELGHIEEIIVQRILLCEVRAVADLRAIVMVEQLLVVIGFRAALVSLLGHYVFLKEHVVRCSQVASYQ
jgi:hypothetical protein